MTLESARASAALGTSARNQATWRRQLPHLDGLVQAARNEIMASRRESNGVNTVLVALGTFETLNEISSSCIPDPNAPVERSSSDVAAIGGDCDGGDAVLNAQSQLLLSIHHIPQANALVTASRSDITAVTSEIERVDILVVSREDVSDLASSNIPNLYLVSINRDI